VCGAAPAIAGARLRFLGGWCTSNARCLGKGSPPPWRGCTGHKADAGSTWVCGAAARRRPRGGKRGCAMYARDGEADARRRARGAPCCGVARRGGRGRAPGAQLARRAGRAVRRAERRRAGGQTWWRGQKAGGAAYAAGRTAPRPGPRAQGVQGGARGGASVPAGADQHCFSGEGACLATAAWCVNLGARGCGERRRNSSWGARVQKERMGVGWTVHSGCGARARGARGPTLCLLPLTRRRAPRGRAPAAARRLGARARCHVRAPPPLPRCCVAARGAPPPGGRGAHSFMRRPPLPRNAMRLSIQRFHPGRGL
jgi:hypothetical protein